MASSGVISGTLCLLYVDGTAVSYSTSCSLSITGPGTIDVSNKDSSYWMEKLQAKGYSWTMSCDGMFAFDGSGVDIRALHGLLRDNTEFTAKMSTGVAGDVIFSGQATSTGFNADFPYNDASTWSFDLEGLGRLTALTT